MICAKCGREIRDDAPFCSFCGAKTSAGFDPDDARGGRHGDRSDRRGRRYDDEYDDRGGRYDDEYDDRSDRYDDESDDRGGYDDEYDDRSDRYDDEYDDRSDRYDDESDDRGGYDDEYDDRGDRYDDEYDDRGGRYDDEYDDRYDRRREKIARREEEIHRRDVRKVKILAGVIAAVLVVAAIGGYFLTSRLLAPRKARESIRQGEQYLEAQNYEAAAEAFTKAAEKDPSNTGAYNGLGKVYAAQAADTMKDNKAEAQTTLKKAEQAYRSAIYKDQNDPDAWYGLGQVQTLQAQAAAAENPAQARQYYQEAVKSYEALKAIDLRPADPGQTQADQNQNVQQAAEQQAAQEQRYANAEREIEELSRMIEELERENQWLQEQNQTSQQQETQNTTEQQPAQNTEQQASQGTTEQQPAQNTEQQPAQDTAEQQPEQSTEQQPEQGAEQQAAQDVPQQQASQGTTEQQPEQGAEQQTAQDAEQQPEQGAEQQTAQDAEQQPEQGAEQQTAQDAEQQTAQDAEQQPEQGAEQQTEQDAEQQGEEENPAAEGSGEDAEPQIIRQAPAGLPEKIQYDTAYGESEVWPGFDETDGTLSLEGGTVDLIGLVPSSRFSDRAFWTLACSLPADCQTEYLLADLSWVKDGNVSRLRTGGKTWDLKTDGQGRLTEGTVSDAGGTSRALSWNYDESGRLTDILADGTAMLHIDYTGELPSWSCSSGTFRAANSADWNYVNVWNDAAGTQTDIAVNESGFPGHVEMNGQARDYIYDTMGRLARIMSGLSGQDPTEMVTYFYSDSVLPETAQLQQTAAESSGETEQAAAPEEQVPGPEEQMEGMQEQAAPAPEESYEAVETGTEAYPGQEAAGGEEAIGGEAPAAYADPAYAGGDSEQWPEEGGTVPAEQVPEGEGY